MSTKRHITIGFHIRGRTFRTGQGVVEYILVLALLALVTVTGIAVAGGGVGEIIKGITGGIRGDLPPLTGELTPGPGGKSGESYALTARPVSSTGEGIAGVAVHVFDSVGNYIDKTATTGSDGQVNFTDLPESGYAVRADYQAHEFWSPVIAFPVQQYVEVETGLRPVDVQVVNAAGTLLSNVDFHVFNTKQQFTGVSERSSDNGISQIELVDGSFKIRADYRGQPHWSQVFTTPEATLVVIEIAEAPFNVRVVDKKNKSVPGIQVYAFNESESYTGIHGTTDDNGQALLDLPNGRYKFRADYAGVDFWSEVLASPQVNGTTIEVGDPPTQVRVINQAGGGIEGVTVYAFKGSGSQYTGESTVTDADGYTEFDLKNGAYTFRADYKNFTYWSEIIAVPKETQATIKVGEGPITIKVVEDGNQAVTSGVYVYAFALIGDNNFYYISEIQEVDGEGMAAFDLPQGEYRFLAYAWTDRNHFRNYYEWSNTISKPPTFEVTIRMR